MANKIKGAIAPLSATQLAQLRTDVADLQAAAARKGFSMDAWEHSSESEAARTHFDLGTWLFYYSTRVGKVGGLQDRIECLRRLFEAGVYSPGYRFYTAFDFGERTFDTCVEMGDADEVIDALREIAHEQRNPNLLGAFKYMGWSLERRQMALF